MQALINAATAPSTATSNVFTNCATETTPKKVVQIALIKPTDAAVHLISSLISNILNKEVGGAYCFWVVRPSVLPSVRPLVTLFDAEHNFRTVNATVLKFLIWFPHEKIADTCFFS